METGQIMEEFIRLDESYLLQAAELFSSSFAGEPWNDDFYTKNGFSNLEKHVSLFKSVK